MKLKEKLAKEACMHRQTKALAKAIEQNDMKAINELDHYGSQYVIGFVDGFDKSRAMAAELMIKAFESRMSVDDIVRRCEQLGEDDV